MARCFHGKMRDVILGECRQRMMQLDRIGRRMGEIFLALRSDDAHRADARGAEAHRLPDLAHEGGDRCLAIGAGDGDDDIGLGAGETRRDAREELMRVAGFDQDRFRRRRRDLIADDHGRRPGGDRLRDELRAVDFRARQSGKKKTRLHLPAVGGEAGDGRVLAALGQNGVIGEKPGKKDAHLRSCLPSPLSPAAWRSPCARPR